MKKLFALIAVIAGLMLGSTLASAQAASAPTGGINGKWHFVLDTPGGDRESDADFTADAEGKVTGTWGKNSVTGTFHDGKLSLSFQMTADETGETADMKIMGTLDDKGVLSGNWQFSAYDGSFTATRPKN